MKHDVLTRASSAVRERYTGDSPRASASEQRVLARAGRRTPASRARLGALLPLAAVLAAASAWAGAGELWPRLRALAAGGPDSETTPAAPLGTLRRTPDRAPSVRAAPLPERASTSAASTSSPIASAARGPDAAPRTERQPRPRKSPTKPAPASTATGGADAGVGSDALALYQAAHHRHFVEGDASGALAAWDAYLNAAPAGSFAPEARYNRALSLVRLGRRAEARVALAPFARGDYHRYRRDEARALLLRLEAP